MEGKKVNSFGRIGKFITKRKYIVILAWLVLLALIVPFALNLGGIVSLQLGSGTDSRLESAQASNIISSQFAATVSNNSLAIVVSSANVSSLQTQEFISKITSEISSNSSISGLENITSVYSVLIPALNQTNQATYTVLDNANLTYNLLYGVPAAYMTIWSTAYNQTQDSLLSGLNQTNQGVYQALENANLTYNLFYSVPTAYMTVWSTAYNKTQDSLLSGLVQTNQGVYLTLDNANLTYNMLFGVPAMYLNVWLQVYNQTQNIPQSNQIAYSQTATLLNQTDPASFNQYTSPLLNAFYALWTASFQDPATQQYTPVQRASVVTDQTNQLYINNYLANNESAKNFATALTTTFSLQDFLTNTQVQNNEKLQTFSIQYVSNSSGASNEFVTAAYNLGRIPDTAAVSALSESIIWNPQTYNMGENFIHTFNEVSYNQTAALLSEADPASFDQYTVHLLDLFNATWSQTFQKASTREYSPEQRALVASSQTNQQYINNYLGSNASTKDFATALTSAFSLQDFLTNTQAQNSAKLLTFALGYVANSSGASPEFVNAAYSLGKNPDANALGTLCKKIIWNPQTYNMGKDFVSIFNEVAYNQTANILCQADAESFNQYTVHLLDLFNASWCQSFQNSQTLSYTPEQRANAASEQANNQYLNTYLGSNADFGSAITQTFSFKDYLTNATEQTAEKLQGFAIGYVSNSSGLSVALVNATFSLGRNCSQVAVENLAGGIVWNPEAYQVGEQLNSLVSTFVSASKDVTLVSVSLKQSSNQNLLIIRDIIKSNIATSPGSVTSALVTGTDALNYDFSKSTEQDLGVILPVTIILLLVATGLFFRSIVTPLVTLGAIGVGLGISEVFILLVGTYINKVDFMIPTVLLTVILGVGTDYGIFIIARHREESVRGLSVSDSIVKSVTWAGESIATSGATVIISFLSLSATSIILLQTLGIVVGLGVIVALCVALTFVPAMVAVLGDKVFWPNSGSRFKKYSESSLLKAKQKAGYFARSGAFSVKRAKILILVAVLVTVPMLYIYATTTPTYDFLGGASGSLESISASQSLTSSFGGGRLSPTYVVVTFSQPLVDNGNFNVAEMSALQAISSYLVNHGDVQEVVGPTMPYGTPVSYANINVTAGEASEYSAMLQNIGTDNKTALITVRLQVAPYSNDAINDAQDIRTSLHRSYDNTAGLTGIYVGGTTGALLDTKNVFVNQFNVILPIVAIGVAIVLFIVLGSLLLPAFAVVSVLMSIVWTLAVTKFVFQSAFNYGLLFITPLILFVLLLGIGMDYNIFILTRIREEAAKGQKLNDAIIHAIEQTGGIITAAAIILAGSLGALMLSSNLLLREMGFAFAFSILIDALVVRTYLVPAVMSTFGKWNWYNPLPWPKRSKQLYEKND